MRKMIARAVAVLALVAGIGVSTTVSADAAPRQNQPQQVTTHDWWW